ncbi:TIGR02281 family clan AA aspartic protease [Chitinimonas arctica]|uniref:TIGR02281 family clan AA aspartic protease n=1 Tax=Chitinimonas arctica TaxID=2594795 RepID=A0A516SEJ9_9NEIS|nr:TIGR02281 family clan AA aspartic protease [Chitinimonas arctica]QDQ26540.1 TIGR02281 family clan AA aspartic protease [Chitinimonas arctica]
MKTAVCMAGVLALLLSQAALAAEPVLLATMGSKASVSFGGKPITLGVGETREGVKLVSVTMESAVFESGGKRSTVRLGQGFFAASVGNGKDATAGSSNTATLYAGRGGHFMAQISSRGIALQGIIDTGATYLSLSGPDAVTLGVKQDRSRPVRMSTAQGIKKAWLTTADEIKLEGITLYNVSVVVSDGDFPEKPLIGMSMLSQLTIQNDGDRMILKKKY